MNPKTIDVMHCRIVDSAHFTELGINFPIYQWNGFGPNVGKGSSRTEEAFMKGKTNRREFIHAAGLAAGAMASVQPLSAAPEPQARPAAAPRTMGAKFKELLRKKEPFENISGKLNCRNALPTRAGFKK